MRSVCHFFWIFCIASTLFGADTLPEWAAPLTSIDCSSYDTNEIDAVCLLDQQQISIEADGTIHHSIRMAYRILTQKGTSYGMTVIPFNGKSKITEMKAWIQYPNNEVKMMKDKDTTETQLLSDSLFSDIKSKVVVLPGTTKNALVCWEYEMKEIDSFPALTWYFQSTIPIIKSSLSLTLPPESKLTWKALELDNFSPVVNGSTYLFQREKTTPITHEPAAALVSHTAQRVLIRVHLPQNGKTSKAYPVYSTWEEYAKWYRQITSDRWQVAPSVKHHAEEICKGLSDPTEKISKLCRWVQSNIRYVSVQIGIGGYVPQPPAEVCQLRYGDCKAKSFLLMTMLRSQGINAWPVICRTRNTGSVDPEFALPTAFNHVITAIQLPNGAIQYFDPTNDVVGYPYLPGELHHTWALVVKDDGCQMVELKPSQKVSTKISVTINWLRVTNTVTANVKEIYDPVSGDDLRATAREQSEEKRKAAWLDLLHERVPQARLTRFGYDNLFEPEKDLIIEYSLDTSGLLKDLKSIYTLSPFFIMDVSKPRLTKPERKHPIDLCPFAGNCRMEIVLALPDDIKVEEGLDNVNIQNPFGQFHLTSEIKDGKLLIIKELNIEPVIIPATQYVDVKGFFQKIANAEKSELLFVKK